jgi:hypothetical protein
MYNNGVLDIVGLSRLVQQFDPHTLPPRCHSLNLLTQRLAMFGPAKSGFLGLACIGQNLVAYGGAQKYGSTNCLASDSLLWCYLRP